MNWMGGGLITVINYVGSVGGIAASNALLTEAGDEILTEASDYLEYEV